MKLNIKHITETVGSWAELVRIRLCLFAFFGVFIGASAFSGEIETTWVVFKTAIALFMLVAAGNLLNDYIDYREDSIYHPERPLPSGRVSKSDAIMASLIFFLVSIGISKQVSTECNYFMVFSAVVLVIYAKYSKKALLISNLAKSYFSAVAFLIGLVVVDPSSLFKFNFVTLSAISIGLLTFSRELVENIHTIEIDRRTYTQTLPTRVGVPISKNLAFFFAGLAIMLTVVPLIMNWPINKVIYEILIFLADVVVLFSFTMKPSTGNRAMVISQLLVIAALFFARIY